MTKGMVIFLRDFYFLLLSPQIVSSLGEEREKIEETLKQVSQQKLYTEPVSWDSQQLVQLRASE